MWAIRLFILPHTLIGLFLVFLALSRIVLCLGVWLDGTDVEGRIIRKTESAGKKGHLYYSAEYVYTVDQADYSGRVSMNAEEYAATREGQAISVRVCVPGVDGGHWPSLGSYSPLEGVAGMCFAALFWNSLMSVAVYQLYYKPWRYRWPVRRGLPAAAIVRDVKRWTNKGTRSTRVQYDYAVPPNGHSAGGVFAGKMTGTGPAGEAIQVGTVVTVLYSPARPHRSLVYRLAEFKALPPRPVTG